MLDALDVLLGVLLVVFCRQLGALNARFQRRLGSDLGKSMETSGTVAAAIVGLSLIILGLSGRL